MPRVIVLDNLAKEGLEQLEKANGIEVTVQTGLAGEELRRTLCDFDGAICRSGVKLDAQALEGNRRLRAIVRAGVGTDNIDKEVAKRQGIIVMNTPTGNTISTAEHTFALMLALSRNVAPAYQSLIEGKWDRKAYMGGQLAEKTLGVVGLGRIGREVAKRARAFEMRVLGFDPYLSDDRAKELGIEPFATVKEMLPRVDYLTVHTPLTEETRNLIDTSSIELLRPGVRLINCARGGIYNEAALVQGLKSGKIAGVALDVYENEPCKDSPLFGMRGVVCTPHLGASTEEAQTHVALEAVELLVNYLTSGEIRHAVNAPAVDPKTLEALRGHLNVAHRLGRLLAQWHEGRPNRCALTYRGDVASKDTRLLTASFCAGLLETAMEDVNIINADVLMKECGIEVVVASNNEKGAFRSSLDAELETDTGTYACGGTLFGNDMPRLIRLGDYRLDAFLDGFLMIFTHDDVPGIIGHVGTILGSHKVNIAQMAVGRASEQPGAEAVGVLNLDGKPLAESVAEVLNHAQIRSVRIIQLPAAGQLPNWLRA
jgi:D-3-phosphoglycerate dehydrogenase